MRKRLMNWGFLFVTLVLMFGLVGCKANEVAQIDEEIQTNQETEAEVVEEEEEEPIPEYFNPLSGMGNMTQEAVGKRPVAVMINNVKHALPQYGVAQADVIFEIPVEANLTRLMALYGDYTQVPKICSIRSCRKYFPAYSEGFDALYVYWGMGDGIEDYVDSLNLTEIRGMSNDGGLFGRDQERRNAGFSLEHTSYFDGTGIPAYVEKKEIRMDIDEDKTGFAFNFPEYGTVVTPTGTPCNIVDVHFGNCLSTFTYDAQSNTYLKNMNGEPHMDGVTGTQLAFTNVIIVETSIGLDDNGLHKRVDWKGSGKGYYVSNGIVQNITWKKDSVESKLLFFDEAGNEIVVNRGKTYIAVNFKEKTSFQ